MRRSLGFLGCPGSGRAKGPGRAPTARPVVSEVSGWSGRSPVEDRVALLIGVDLAVVAVGLDRPVSLEFGVVELERFVH